MRRQLVFALLASVPLATPASAIDCSNSLNGGHGYALVCKAGVSYTLAYHRALAAHERLIYTEKFSVRMKIGNRGASAGETGKGLAPGACAWQDRAIRSSEPRAINIGVIDVIPGQIVGGEDYSALSTDLFKSLEHCDHEAGCVFKLCVRTQPNEKAFVLTNPQVEILPDPK